MDWSDVCLIELETLSFWSLQRHLRSSLGVVRINRVEDMTYPQPVSFVLVRRQIDTSQGDIVGESTRVSVDMVPFCTVLDEKNLEYRSSILTGVHFLFENLTRFFKTSDYDQSIKDHDRKLFCTHCFP
jgi:hypothetical protein